MFDAYRVIHFVGIGGIGMSGIAEVLHNLGYEVTGSDLRESETTSRLRGLGVKVAIGHDGENVDHAHVVVISSAVSPDNPEVREARERGIPVIPRAEMLAELGRLKYGILVAGAHGKTTTTSLVATILGQAGLDPTVVIGGKLKALGTNARLGQGDFLVAEADESDGSFLKLNPTIAVVTNIDREHMDFFKDMGPLKAAFLAFANKIPFYGTAIVCIENEHVREILPRIERKVVTYGFSGEADIRAQDVTHSGARMGFEVVAKGKSLGRFVVPVPGKHNVLNSLAAIGAALELHTPSYVIRKALANFGGIQRRFERKGEAGGVRIFDDYGHHPAEIRAVLKAARECFNGSRLVVVFQPHRYTRTNDLMDEFAKSFGAADHLFLMDIYPAGEKPLDGVSSAALLDKLEKRGQRNLTYRADRAELVGMLRASLAPGDVVITLGAGDVYRVGEQLLSDMKGPAA
ncbi:MAG: UDP-N-acetylmuramate--L-alanine ligase [Chloroflexota bacterium]